MALEIFRLVGSVFVDTDDADKSLQKIDKNAESFGSTLLNGIKTAAKWAAGIATAAGAAATALSAASIKAYADYEQLVGGVETLFKDSANMVFKYAEVAYKTAGMSANQYMETVTGFSATLLQGLGGDTAEAARMADLAITDMADNANKMGTSMESIRNAYQGFAKQTYNMLDNLKLGYGGTQKEMLRLLEDAQKLDSTFDAVFYMDEKGHLEANFNDIIQAIHIIQTEMGITGTTAQEAMSTISGNINMIKAKCEDFKTTIGSALAPVVKNFLALVIDNLPAIENCVNKLATVWIPALIATITSCSTWISKNTDKIVEWTGYIVAAGAAVGTFLVYMNWGQIMSTASAALNLVTSSIKKMTTTMMKNPIGLIISLVAALTTYLVYLYNTNEEFRAKADEVLSAVWAKLQVVFAWIQANVMPTVQRLIAWLSENVPPVMAMLVEWVQTKLLPALQVMIAWIQANVIPVIQKIAAWIKETLIPAIGMIITWVKDDLFPAIQTVIGWIKENVIPIVEAVVSWIGEKISSFFSWFVGLFESTADSTGGIWEKIKGFFKSAWDFIVGIWEACQPFFQGVWDGVIMPVAELIEEMIGAFKMAWDVIVLVWEKGEPFFSAIWEGIKNEVQKTARFVSAQFETAWGLIKAVWDISVSHFTRVWAGIKAVFAVVKGVLSGNFSDAWDAIKNYWDQAKDYFKSIYRGIIYIFEPIVKWFGDVFTSAWEAVKNVFSSWGSFFGNLWTQIQDKFSAIGTNISNAISSSVKAGLNGVISAIEGIINTGVNMINGAINLINNIPGVSIGHLEALSLPRLAKGGVVDSPTIAQIGENGAEAIVPLENNMGWVDKLLERIADSRETKGAESVETKSLDAIIDRLDMLISAVYEGQTIKINEREFARTVREYA